MMKTFSYMTDSKHTYGVEQLGLNKGDFFKLIETKISSIEKTIDSSVYKYDYLIHIPKLNRCFILDDYEWGDLVNHSDYIEE